MKELSIEQKAQAYDKVVNKLKGFMAQSVDPLITRADIQDFFPELAESEDERIRKMIINTLNRDKILTEDEAYDCVTWLEKQGEQKPTAEEVLIKAGLKPYKDGDQWCVLLGDNIQEGICGFGNTIEDALYAFLKDLIASRGEQKSIKVPKFKAGDFIQFNGMGHTRYTVKEVCGLSHYINTCNKRMDMSYTDANFELVEHKPAEWSEEDENISSAIIKRLCGSDALSVSLQSAICWVENVKDRVQPQPKQEWSEEDEEAIAEAIIALEDMYDGDSPLNCYVGYKLPFNKAAERLKSLRPRLYWKPSEEQIKAVKLARSFVVDDFNEHPALSEILIELEEQLKKL